MNRWKLEKLFNKANHDILMSKLEKKIKDKRLLSLIRKYLKQRNLVKLGINKYKKRILENILSQIPSKSLHNKNI